MGTVDIFVGNNLIIDFDIFVFLEQGIFWYLKHFFHDYLFIISIA